ncbi:MAG: YheU family protein [Pseudomonadota bacterium]
MEVPFSALSAEVLQRLVESFVLREGTDYGAQEFTHDQKVAQVIAQLKSGEARILYDPATESVTLLPKK